MNAIDRTTGRLDLLTQSERECLRMVAQHMRSKEIARQRGTSPYTVNRQIENAIRKLGAADRHDAARMWLQEEPATRILSGSSYDTFGIVNSPPLPPSDGATETSNVQSELSSHGDGQLYLEAARRAAERSGGDPRTGLDGATPGVGPGQAVPLPRRDHPAQRDHENGGLRVRSSLHEILSGQRALSPRSWIIIFALSAFLGAMLLAGMLSAVSASFGLVTAITGR